MLVNMKNKTVVVTGGAGFFGSNLVRELAHQNHVIIIDDLSTGHINNIQDFIDANKIEFIRGICDGELAINEGFYYKTL